MQENETKEIQEESNPTDVTEAPTEEIIEEEANNEETEKVGNKTFTQEEVNNIVSDRLSRKQENFYKKLGVENEEQIDELLNIAKESPQLKDLISEQKKQIDDLNQQLAFMQNDIDPNRYDDIKALFKGKELEFSNEALIEELKTHPEWLNKKEQENTTTIKSLSADHSKRNIAESEDEKIKRVFGI